MLRLQIIRSALVAMLLAAPALAQDRDLTPPPEGSVSQAEGLAAFDRIFAVVTHPRCANCHPGPSDRPMWSGDYYGETRPHGMNIRAGESRIGAETLPCQTCHATTDIPQTTPHAAPRGDQPWLLAPVEAHWFGQTVEFICAQLRDPERNGGLDVAGLVDHLDHDGFVAWGWSPGPGRETPPGTLQDHIDDVLAWGVAGQPCPGDG